MNYLVWALLALVAYSLVAPLTKLASNDVPIMVVALVTNAMITGVNLLVVLRMEDGVLQHLVQPGAAYMYAAGVFLTVGVLAYFYALSIGPVSSVVPIYGSFLVVSALIGVVVLGETATLPKLLGIGLAAVAIYLTTLD